MEHLPGGRIQHRGRAAFPARRLRGAPACAPVRTVACGLRALQSDGILTEHRVFLESDPSFGSLVGRRIEHITATTVDVTDATRAREALNDWLQQVLSPGTCVLLPSAPGAAPLKGQPDDDVDLYTGRLLMLTSLASLCGTPQISMPLSRADCWPSFWMTTTPRLFFIEVADVGAGCGG